MNKINWSSVTIIGIVVLIAVFIGISLFGGGRGYGGWGMMGPGMMGGWGFAPFGWIGMLFMWLVPVGFLVLTVLGIVWLVRTLGSGNNPPASTKTCPSCGRGVQADWRNCPHCGAALG
ncbi:MAG: zinc ribbon domain-containing protein [Chloroflexi bacterium]|nr:zinc ribbon domain-containing protein [Chloroflexota bacterium]